MRPVEAGLFHADGRSDRQTEGHDEANNLFSQFFERAWIYRAGWIQLALNRVRIIAAILPYSWPAERPSGSQHGPHSVEWDWQVEQIWKWQKCLQCINRTYSHVRTRQTLVMNIRVTRRWTSRCRSAWHTDWRLTFCCDRDSGGDHNSPGDTTKCTVPLGEGRGRNRAKGRRDF